MLINMNSVSRVFGDRILVRRLDKPEKIRGLFVPENASKDKPAGQDVWFAVIEKFGLDSRFGEAYGLKEGDIIGIDAIGNQCAAFDGEDGFSHSWVAEEFVVCKDEGWVKAYRDGKDLKLSQDGLRPLGSYSLINPHPEEEKRGGVYLPSTAKQETRTGTVLSVSDGELRGGDLVPLNVFKGSDVILGKYSGVWAKFGALSFVFAKQEDIIAEYVPVTETANV